MKLHPDYLRSLMFGLEDALVSTTGAVIGVAAGSQNRDIILLASFVYISVEALSMGAGQYLSERAVHELESRTNHPHTDNLITGSVIMFIAYCFGGLIPTLPFLLLPLAIAIPCSLTAAFISLFILGYAKGKFVKISATKSALEMLIIGGLAALIGVGVGYLLKI